MRKAGFRNRGLGNSSLGQGSRIETGLREEGHVGTKQSQPSGRNCGRSWDKLAVLLLHVKMKVGNRPFCEIALPFFGIFGRSGNCKKILISKEVLVGDQYLREAREKTSRAAIKELLFVPVRGTCQHVPRFCTAEGAPGRLRAEDSDLNIPTSPPERSLSY